MSHKAKAIEATRLQPPKLWDIGSMFGNGRDNGGGDCSLGMIHQSERHAAKTMTHHHPSMIVEG